MSLDYLKSLDALAILSAAMACAVDRREEFIRIDDIRHVIAAISPYDTVLEECESMDGWHLDRVRVVFWELAQTFNPSNTLRKHH